MRRGGLAAFPTTAREDKQGSVMSTRWWGKDKTTVCISSTKTWRVTTRTCMEHPWLQLQSTLRAFPRRPTWLGLRDGGFCQISHCSLNIFSGKAKFLGSVLRGTFLGWPFLARLLACGWWLRRSCSIPSPTTSTWKAPASLAIPPSSFPITFPPS